MAASIRDSRERLLQTAWHEGVRNTVQHLLNIPEGSEFQVGDIPDQKSIVLTGDALAGFKFGIELTMMQLGTLPLVAEFEDEPTPPGTPS